MKYLNVCCSGFSFRGSTAREPKKKITLTRCVHLRVIFQEWLTSYLLRTCRNYSSANSHPASLHSKVCNGPTKTRTKKKTISNRKGTPSTIHSRPKLAHFVFLTSSFVDVNFWVRKAPHTQHIHKVQKRKANRSSTFRSEQVASQFDSPSQL